MVPGDEKTPKSIHRIRFELGRLIGAGSVSTFVAESMKAVAGAFSQMPTLDKGIENAIRGGTATPAAMRALVANRDVGTVPLLGAPSATPVNFGVVAAVHADAEIEATFTPSLFYLSDDTIKRDQPPISFATFDVHTITTTTSEVNVDAMTAVRFKAELDAGSKSFERLNTYVSRRHTLFACRSTSCPTQPMRWNVLTQTCAH